jgi:hypothetical protein
MINEHNTKILTKIENVLDLVKHSKDNICGFYLVMPYEEDDKGYIRRTLNEEKNLAILAIIDDISKSFPQDSLKLIIKQLQNMYDIRYETKGAV